MGVCHQILKPVKLWFYKNKRREYVVKLVIRRMTETIIEDFNNEVKLIKLVSEKLEVSYPKYPIPYIYIYSVCSICRCICCLLVQQYIKLSILVLKVTVIEMLFLVLTQQKDMMGLIIPSFGEQQEDSQTGGDKIGFLFIHMSCIICGTYCH